jgi:hypothetical protein
VVDGEGGESVRERYGKIAAKIDRVQGAKEIASMDQEHFDQLRSMLASAGFGPKHPIPQGLRPLADFVAASDGQLAVASWLTDGASAPGRSLEANRAGNAGPWKVHRLNDARWAGGEDPRLGARKGGVAECCL